MTDTSGEGTHASLSPPATAIAIAPPNKKSWWDQLPLIIATAIIGLMFTLGQNFGTRISTTTDKAIELNTIVQQISDDIKDQKTEFKDIRNFQQVTALKLGTLVTRDELQRFQDEFSRKFTELSGQVNAVNSRIERAENQMRMLQDTIRVLQDALKITQEAIVSRNANPQRH